LLFCIGFGAVFGLYCFAGLYTTGKPPNSEFWGSLGGLIKDGVVSTMGGHVEKIDSKVGINDVDRLTAPVLTQVTTDHQSPVGRKKKKKRKPSQEGERIVIVDPVTGKKKVKKKVKRGTAKPARDSSSRKAKPAGRTSRSAASLE
jgi:hypothetical protein